MTNQALIAADSRDFWRITLALCLGSFLVFANLYITHPLMPMLSQQFQLTELEASWSLALPLLTLGLSLLIYGPLSDAIGRRNIMLITLLAGLITSLLISQVESYGALLLLRGLQGFLLGGLPALGVAYLGDHLQRPALLLAVGFYISANSLGGVSGRILSALLADFWGWEAAFAGLALASTLGMLVFYRLLPRQEVFQAKPLRLKTALSDLGKPLSQPVLLLAYLIGGGNFLVFSNQYSYLTYRLSESPFNLPTSLVGLLFLTYLSGSLGAALSGRMAQRLSIASCMQLGIVLMSLGLMTTLWNSLTVIIGGLLICSFGFFLCHTMTSTWVNQHASEARASASSLYLVAYYLGASVGGFYLDPLWQTWNWPGVIAGSLIIMMITGTVASRLKRVERCQAALPASHAATPKPAFADPD